MSDKIQSNKIQSNEMWIINKKRKLCIDYKKLINQVLGKRKILYCELKNLKKQKKIQCIFHDEKYICDIYECCGISHNIKYNHMPYIN